MFRLIGDAHLHLLCSCLWLIDIDLLVYAAESVWSVGLVEDSVENSCGPSKVRGQGLAPGVDPWFLDSDDIVRGDLGIFEESNCCLV